MPRYTGKDVVVKFGTVNVSGKGRALEIQQGTDEIDDSSYGSAAKEFITGLIERSGTLQILDDNSSALIRNTFGPGSVGSLTWWPIGTASGNPQFQAATAVVKEANVSYPYDDAVVIDVSLRLSGSVLETVVGGGGGGGGGGGTAVSGIKLIYTNGTAGASGTPAATVMPNGKLVSVTVSASGPTSVTLPVLTGGSGLWNVLEIEHTVISKSTWFFWGVGNGTAITDITATGANTLQWQVVSYDNAYVTAGGTDAVEEFHSYTRLNGNLNTGAYYAGFPATDTTNDMTLLIGSRFNDVVGTHPNGYPGGFSQLDSFGVDMTYQRVNADFMTTLAWKAGSTNAAAITMPINCDGHWAMVKIRAASTGAGRPFHRDVVQSVVNGFALYDNADSTNYTLGSAPVFWTPAANSLIIYRVTSVKSGGSPGPTGVTGHGLTFDQVGKQVSTAVSLISGTLYEFTVPNTADFNASQAVSVQGYTPTGYNGCYTTFTVMDSTHIRIDVGSNPGAVSVQGYVAPAAKSGDYTLTAWRALDASPASGRPTVAHASAHIGCGATGMAISGVNTGGTNGSAACRQVATAAASAATITATFGQAAGASDNAVVAGFASNVNATGVTYPSRFTPGDGYAYGDQVNDFSAGNPPPCTVFNEWQNKFQATADAAQTGATLMLAHAIEVAHP